MGLFIVIVCTLLTTLLLLLRRTYNYWEIRGVPQPKLNFLFGTFFQLKTLTLGELSENAYQQFKGKAKLVGTYIFWKPVIILLDLDLIKNILIKDFNNFVDRTDDIKMEEIDPLTLNLFRLSGDKWRGLRMKLSPTFTSGKMKYMFPTILKVANDFNKVFEQELTNSPNGTLEVYDLTSRFTTDVIGTCIFGVECNSLNESDNQFRAIGRKIFQTKYFSIRWKIFNQTYMHILKYFGARAFSEEILNFIMNMVRETVETREKYNIKRNDFMDMLIELKNKKDDKGNPSITMEEIAAQVFLFFGAGFETSSSNMAFAIYELAKNPEIQERVRTEIYEVLEKHNGEITYEALYEMNYLGQVINETLRKYPALVNLTRMAAEDYNIPGTKIVVPKGTKLFIPVKEIHYDPEIYDKPDEFRPERFEPEEIKKRHPQSFLSFGDGPRNCIGLRFGGMQSRVGLVTLLKGFRFSTCESTPKNFVQSPYNLVVLPTNGFRLKIEKI